MRKLVYYIGVSLDGYIAGPGGEVDFYPTGGGKLAGTLLPEIDELVIKSYPVLAGSGVPMISGGFQPTQFTPTRRQAFDNGVFVTWYSRVPVES